MRVALVCTEMLPVPAVRGGAIQIFIENVAPRLAVRHDVTVFGIRDPYLPDHEWRGRLRFIRVPPREYPEHVAARIARRGFDVIHVFNRPRDVLVYRAAAPASRIILNLSNEMFAADKLSHDQGLQVVDTVEKILTVSDYLGRTVVTRFPAAASLVHTVYSGVDLDRFRPWWFEGLLPARLTLKRRLGIGGRPVVLMVSRLSAVKGVDVAIRAMMDMAGRQPEAVLLCVGSRWYGSDTTDSYGTLLHRLAAEIPGRVVFTGFVPPIQMAAYYLAGDVFLCASQWHEPLARVHFEALAAGLPIITTPRGGNGEVVRHLESGLLVEDFQNPRAFAAAVDILLGNPGLVQQLGARGRRLAEERFGWDRVAAELLGYYEETSGG